MTFDEFITKCAQDCVDGEALVAGQLHHPDCPYREDDPDSACTCPPSELASRWKARWVLANAEVRSLSEQIDRNNQITLEIMRERDGALDQVQRLGKANVNGVLDLRNGESLVDCAVRLTRERDEARALLREGEWGGTAHGDYGYTARKCLFCGGICPLDYWGKEHGKGHTHDCRLALLLNCCPTCGLPVVGRDVPNSEEIFGRVNPDGTPHQCQTWHVT